MQKSEHNTKAALKQKKHNESYSTAEVSCVRILALPLTPHFPLHKHNSEQHYSFITVHTDINKPYLASMFHLLLKLLGHLYCSMDTSPALPLSIH